MKRLETTLGVLFTVLLVGSASAQELRIDLASQPIRLQPNLAGQGVRLYLDNLGAADVRALATTLKFQLDDGVVGGEATPALTGIDAVTGTPWALAGGVQITATSQPESWDVRVFADFLGGQEAVLPASIATFLASVTFDTTGVGPGVWSLRVAGLALDPTETKYELNDGRTYYPTTSLGTVTVVPEAATTALCAGVGLVVLAVTRRCRGPRGGRGVKPVVVGAGEARAGLLSRG